MGWQTGIHDESAVEEITISGGWDVACVAMMWQEEGESLSLLRVMELTRSFHSADPRDRIIALLGLAPQNDQVAAYIKPDYEQSIAEFFHDVTGTIIVQSRSFTILSLVEECMII